MFTYNGLIGESRFITSDNNFTFLFPRTKRKHSTLTKNTY